MNEERKKARGLGYCILIKGTRESNYLGLKIQGEWEDGYVGT
jgi:hypothetical protein